jgi:hypothetical protein
MTTGVGLPTPLFRSLAAVGGRTHRCARRVVKAVSSSPTSKALNSAGGFYLACRRPSSSGRPAGFVWPFPACATPDVRAFSGGLTVGKGRGLAAAISSSVQGRAGLGLSADLMFPTLLGVLAACLRLVIERLHFDRLGFGCLIMPRLDRLGLAVTSVAENSSPCPEV